MLWLSHLKQVAALFVFVKSTKPNFSYPICKLVYVYCMYHLIFHGARLPEGLIKSNTAFQMWIVLT